MLRMLRWHTIIIVLLTLSLVSTQLVKGAVNEIIDSFDKNTCSYCYAYRATFHEGKAVFVGVNETDYGIVAYNVSGFTWKSVYVSVTVQITNETSVAVWVTSTEPTQFVNGVSDFTSVMVGEGVSVALGYSNTTGRRVIRLMFTDSTGFTHGSIIVERDLSYGYDNAKVVVVSVGYSMVTSDSGMLTLYVDGSQIAQVSTKWFAPKYVAVVGSGRSFNYSCFLDFVSVILNTFSPYEVIVYVPTPMYVIAPSVYIAPSNVSYLYILYMCYYHGSPSECPNMTIMLFNSETNNLLYSVNVTPSSTETHLFVFKDYAYTYSANNITYKVYMNNDLYKEGFILMPKAAVLYANPYTSVIALLLPFSVIVALAVKTESVKSIGIGMIASGLVLIMLPMIGIIHQNLYIVSMILMALGATLLYLNKE